HQQAYRQIAERHGEERHQRGHDEHEPHDSDPEAGELRDAGAEARDHAATLRTRQPRLVGGQTELMLASSFIHGCEYTTRAGSARHGATTALHAGLAAPTRER